MRYNGTIRYYLHKEDVTFNEYGEIAEPDYTGNEESTSDEAVATAGEEVASEPQSDWSEPIRCSVQTTRNDNVRRTADNVERVCSFIVLLPASSGFDFRSRNKVRLERHGEDLGEFEVITSEHVSTQGRIKLVV